ncbi:MAG: DUF4250 domain-containing protein [Lachnospiraceae bacterium]|nr:DUF4250 domain-containing protein [Lachnospiraceae bacterium]
MLPEDPIILLSFVNMRLRDEYSDLDDLCDSLDIDKSELTEKLEKAGYRYDAENHCFK